MGCVLVDALMGLFLLAALAFCIASSNAQLVSTSYINSNLICNVAKARFFKCCKALLIASKHQSFIVNWTHIRGEIQLLYMCQVSVPLQAPAITGPATGICGAVPIRYGTSGAGTAKVQTFVSPAPLFISSCFPTATDTYVYSLGVSQQSNYILPGPGL